jgi:hypothetical protein
MNSRSSFLVIALTLSGAMPATAQTQIAPDQSAAEKAQQHERAERCRQNRGVDCSTPEGLKEWELLERSREEAVKEGSRHRRPVQPIPPKTVR